MRYQAFESFKIIIAVIVGLLLISLMVSWLNMGRTPTQPAACAGYGGEVKTVTIDSTQYFICCKNGKWVGLIWDKDGNTPETLKDSDIATIKNACKGESTSTTSSE